MILQKLESAFNCCILFTFSYSALGIIDYLFVVLNRVYIWKTGSVNILKNEDFICTTCRFISLTQPRLAKNTLILGVVWCDASILGVGTGLEETFQTLYKLKGWC